MMFLFVVSGAICPGCVLPCDDRAKLDPCEVALPPSGTIERPTGIPSPPWVQIRAITPNNPVVICASVDAEQFEYVQKSDQGEYSRVEIYAEGSMHPAASHNLGPGFAASWPIHPATALIRIEPSTLRNAFDHIPGKMKFRLIVFCRRGASHRSVKMASEADYERPPP